MKLRPYALLLSPLLLGSRCREVPPGPGLPDDLTAADPPASLRVEAEDLLITSETGQTASFTVRLNKPPLGKVEVSVESPDPNEWRQIDAEPVAADITEATSLQIQRTLTLRYPHTDQGIVGDHGLHNQGYHFDGAQHFSTGTQGDGLFQEISWVFVHHNDGTESNGWSQSLQCASRLFDPFVAAEGEPYWPWGLHKIHTGGGWYRDGRYYTPVSNEAETDGDLTGQFTIVSFGANPDCDAATDPDAFTADGEPLCPCDVQWDLDERGTPILYDANDYMGLGVLMEVSGSEKAVILSTTGHAPWVCEPDGTACQTWSCATGGSDCTDDLPQPEKVSGMDCTLDGITCVQACADHGSGEVCTDFPPVLATETAYLYLFSPEDLSPSGEFTAPSRALTLPTDAERNGEVGHTSSEGIALYDGEVYLAGDHTLGQKGACDALGVVAPCTNADGDQVVRVYAPILYYGQRLTFDRTNWDIPQPLTLQGLDDLAPDGDREGSALIRVESVETEWAALSGTQSVSVRNLDDETAEADLTLDALSPAVGSEIGGTPVLITGTGLASARQVLFGAEPAELIGADIGTLAVLAPAHAPGPVDITVVRDDAATATLPAAFTYYADADGQYGGIARALIVDYDPSIFWIGSGYGEVGDTYLQVDGLFHAPIPSEQTLFGADPWPGSCVGAGGASWTALPAADGMVLSSPHGETMAMGDYDDIVFYALIDAVEPSTWSGQALDLTLTDPDSPIPAQSIVDAALMPGYPTVVDGLGFGWFVSATNVHIKGQDLTLSWTADAPIDGLSYTIWPGAGTTPLAEVSCTIEGAGPLTLTWEELLGGADPAAVNTLMISLTFWRDHNTEMAHDRSLFWGRGYYQLWYYVVLTPG